MLFSNNRQYGSAALSEVNLGTCPFVLFESWLSEAIAHPEIQDANAMILSTVDELGAPDARTVLLKEFVNQKFIFYTNYLSVKGKQIQSNPKVSLVFFWSALSRQIRIKGSALPIDALQSDAYFKSRPYLSQVSAIVSPQSQVIPDRKSLEQAVQDYLEINQERLLTRPEHWGGYHVIATEIEFWQGRDDRLSDRIKFNQNETGSWVRSRLAP